MTIAVDFDGTIVEHRYPKIGEEIPFATETLKILAQERHKLILWTVREGELLKKRLNGAANGESFSILSTRTIRKKKRVITDSPVN